MKKSGRKDSIVFKGICIFGIVATLALFGLALFSDPQFRPSLVEVIWWGIALLIVLSWIAIREFLNRKVSKSLKGLADGFRFSI
jgi:hypothetical protein